MSSSNSTSEKQQQQSSKPSQPSTSALNLSGRRLRYQHALSDLKASITKDSIEATASVPYPDYGFGPSTSSFHHGFPSSLSPSMSAPPHAGHGSQYVTSPSSSNAVTSSPSSFPSSFPSSSQPSKQQRKQKISKTGLKLSTKLALSGVEEELTQNQRRKFPLEMDDE